MPDGHKPVYSAKYWLDGGRIPTAVQSHRVGCPPAELAFGRISDDWSALAALAARLRASPEMVLMSNQIAIKDSHHTSAWRFGRVGKDSPYAWRRR